MPVRAFHSTIFGTMNFSGTIFATEKLGEKIKIHKNADRVNMEKVVGAPGLEEFVLERQGDLLAPPPPSMEHEGHNGVALHGESQTGCPAPSQMSLVVDQVQPNRPGGHFKGGPGAQGRAKDMWGGHW